MRKIKPKGIRIWFFIFLNLLIDLIPKNIGTITACKCAENNRKKNKLIKLKFYVSFHYFIREIYHFPTRKINKVRTRGNAG